MKLLIPASILAQEMHPLKGAFSLAILISSAKKVSKGLGIAIAGAPKASRFIKIPFTSKEGAGSLLFLVRIQESYLVPLLMRKKTDLVGYNMSPQNSLFLRTIEKNLALALKDISQGDFEMVDL